MTLAPLIKWRQAIIIPIILMIARDAATKLIHAPLQIV